LRAEPDGYAGGWSSSPSRIRAVQSLPFRLDEMTPVTMTAQVQRLV
jgi:hypothetical protein